MKRFGILAFGAVILATAILAVLGYVSLRQWEASAELLFREQARDMAAMAAEKLEMAIVKSEEECLASLQLLVAEPGFRPNMLAGWTARTPLFDRVHLFDRQGRLLYPALWRPEDAGIFARLLAEIPQGFWERGGRRHLTVGRQVVLAAVIQGPGQRPVLAALGRSDEVLRREVLERTLWGLEGKACWPSSTRTIDRSTRRAPSTAPSGCSPCRSARPCRRGGSRCTSPRVARRAAPCAARPCSSALPSPCSWS